LGSDSACPALFTPWITLWGDATHPGLHLGLEMSGKARERNKKMAKAIRGLNLGNTVAIALLAALLLMVGLVFAVQQATTTTDRGERPAIGADRAGGSSFARDPYVERHAAVVSRYRGVTPATSQDGDEGRSLTRDPAIERHAEIVARYTQDNPR
jgi:hypothetical protein